MKSKIKFWLTKENILKTIHFFALMGMLQSTVAAPLLGIADAYYFNHGYYDISNFSLNPDFKIQENNRVSSNNQFSDIQTLGASGNINSELNSIPEKPIAPNNSISLYSSDIQEGTIGVTADIPFDNGADNIFKVNIAELPQKSDRVYLTYELLGVQDFNAVSRSINNRPSAGGYIIKTNNEWSQQKEEIDAEWLVKGENRILFTLANKARHFYKIKNLKIDIEKSDKSDVIQQLVIQQQNTVFSKEGKAFIKGFIRSYHKNASVDIDGIKLDAINGEFEGTVPLENKNQKFLLASAIDENGLIGQITIPIKKIVEADLVYPIEKSVLSVSELFNPALSKSMLSIDGALITLSDSSISNDVLVSIAQLRKVDIAPLESGMYNVTKGGNAYRFSPDGMKFNKPVKISIGYDTTLIPNGYKPEDVKTFFFNTSAKRWEAVQTDTIDKLKNTVVSYTNHFTDYINGIIQVPESPQTSAFAPTMMNDIKAADPSSEITLITPPEPSQTGEANLSYPIKIPTGRNGMQPNLVLQYSSDGEESWVGYGWNLGVQGISIDSRWGVPTFGDLNGDGDISDVGENIETEIYSLGGEQLMYPQFDYFFNGKTYKGDWMPNRHFEVPETHEQIVQTRPRLLEADANFTPRIQGSFAKIQRLGNSPSTYYWKVTSTDGTINWYGGKTPSDVSSGIAVIKNPANNNIVFWGLYMTEDVYGNNILYKYDHGPISTELLDKNPNLKGGELFLINEIDYTGFNGNPGNYKINFIPQNDMIRSDLRINGRNGFKQIEPFLLDHIDISYKESSKPTPTVIRSYKFNIKPGTFGKNLLKSIAEYDINGGNKFYEHNFQYYNDIMIKNEPSAFSSEVIENLCLKCYDVDFPVPMATVPLFLYDLSRADWIYSFTGSSCLFPQSLAQIKNIKVDGITHTPSPNDLYLTHFFQNAVTNLCPSNSVILNSSPCYQIQNENFEEGMKQFIYNNAFSAIQPFDVIVNNESYVSMAPNPQLAPIYHQIHYSGSFKSLINTTGEINTIIYNTTISRAYSTLFTNINAGISTIVKITTEDGIHEFGPYTLSDQFYVDKLQQDLISYYQDASPIVTSAGGSINITIPESKIVFNSITLIGGGVTLNYNFSPCGDNPAKKSNYDWSNAKLENADVEWAIKKAVANGDEVNMPIPEIPVNILFDESELLTEFKDKLQNETLIAVKNVKGNNDTINPEYFRLYFSSDSISWTQPDGNFVMDTIFLRLLNSFANNTIKPIYLDFQNQHRELIFKQRIKSQTKAKEEIQGFIKNKQSDFIKIDTSNLPKSKLLNLISEKNPGELNTSKKIKVNTKPSFDPLINRYRGSFAPVDSKLTEGCPPDENTSLNIVLNTPTYNTTSSLLGTTSANSVNIGVYAGFGLGCDPLSKRTTFGLQFNMGWNWSESFVTMIDIDGDGLDDIVNKPIYSNEVFFKKHFISRSYADDGSVKVHHFYSENKKIIGISNFFKQSGTSYSVNGQLTSLGFAGADKAWSTTSTNIYFTDANGDGLIDVVKNGTVFFNHLEEGIPNFEADSKRTENMVIVSEAKAIEVPKEITQPSEITFPNADVVKVWEAPATGAIKIENYIELTDLTKEAEVSIELKRSHCYQSTINIPYTTATLYQYQIANNSSWLVNSSYSSAQCIFPKSTARVHSVELNGITYSAPSNLYLNHFIEPAMTNLCPNPPENPNTWPTLNTITQNQEFAGNCTNWLHTFVDQYFNPNYTPNLATNPSVTVYNFSGLLKTTVSGEAKIDNRAKWEGYFFSWNSALSGQSKISAVNSNIIPIFELLPASNINLNQMWGNVLIGIPVIIKVVASGIETPFGPYDLLDPVEIGLFQSEFINTYPGSTAPSITMVGYNLNIEIPSTDYEFSTITLAATGINQQYYFTECSGDFKNNIIAKSYDKSYLSDQDLYYAALKMIVNGKSEIQPQPGNQLTLVVYPEEINGNAELSEPFVASIDNESIRWYDKSGLEVINTGLINVLTRSLPNTKENLYAEYLELEKKSTIIANESTFERAQKALNDYYELKKQEGLKRIADKSNSERVYSSLSSQPCLLFGTKLNNSLPINNVITNKSIYCDPDQDILTVIKGDRIYFRVHNVENGNPPVIWNPKIEYTDPVLATLQDQNGQTPYKSSYSDGFILSASNSESIMHNGSVKITWPALQISGQTDNITFSVSKYVYFGENEIPDPGYTITWNTIINAGATVNVVPDGWLANDIVISGCNDPVPSRTVFVFNVSSPSNVKWNQINWRPKLLIKSDNQVLIGKNNTPEGEFKVPDEIRYPIVDYSIYKSYLKSTPYVMYTIPVSGSNRTITPLLSGLFNSTDKGVLNFVVKGNQAFIGSNIITVENGTIQGITPISIPSGVTNIEISYLTDDTQLKVGTASFLEKIANSTSAVALLGSGSSQYGIYKGQINLLQKPNQQFGPLYRQWGQFMYNPDAIKAPDVPIAFPTGSGLPGYFICENALNLYSESQDFNTLFQNINNTVTNANNIVLQEDQDPGGVFDPIQTQIDAYSKNAFILAYPYRNSLDLDITYVEKWNGIHDHCYADALSSCAAGFTQYISGISDPDDEIVTNVEHTGMNAITKITKGDGLNFSAGAGPISGSLSRGGHSKSLYDFIDMNGDMYPDLVSTENMQLTNRTGGLSLVDLTPENPGYLIESNNKGFGVACAGSFPASGKANGGTSCNGINPTFKAKLGSGVPNGNQSISISANYSKDKDFTDRMYIDINGDGLADLVEKSNETSLFNITLNLGNAKVNNTELGQEIQMASFHQFLLNSSSTQNIGSGWGISLKSGSFEDGMLVNQSNNSIHYMLQDMNADGLIDLVVSDEGSFIYYANTGTSFIPLPAGTSEFQLTESSGTTTTSTNLGLSYGFPIPVPLLGCIKIAVGLNGSNSNSNNRTEKSVMDFDGDGFPDLVRVIDNNQVGVMYSNVRRTNKLQTVTNSLGGSFTIDYKVADKGYNNPRTKWVMSEVTVNDGYDLSNDGVDSYTKNYEYENGKYDRRERDFLGFETVKTIEYNYNEEGKKTDIYRTNVSVFLNSSYYLKGLLKEQYVCKGNNSELKFSSKENTYEIKTLKNNNTEIDLSSIHPLTFDVGGKDGCQTAAVLLTDTYSKIYELGTSPIITKSSMEYDSKGRVNVFNYYGIESDTKDDYKTTIEYYDNASLTAKNIINIPSSITVSADGKTVRKRLTDNINNSTGDIRKIKTLLDGMLSVFAETDIEYNTYGNITKLTLPTNSTGERMYYNYTYDPVENKYNVQVSDAFGYTSSSSYSYLFDKVTQSTDMAGNSIQNQYDNFGRLVKIIGPNEAANGTDAYTLRFQYLLSKDDPQCGCSSISQFLPVAITKHYDPQHTSNPIETYSFIDGLGRAVQIKKDIEINTNPNRSGTATPIEMLSVSGKTNYDHYGRAIQQYLPNKEAQLFLTNVQINNNILSSTYKTITDFDELDRPVKTTDPEGNFSTFEYSVSAGLLKTRSITDQNSVQSVISESYKDASGNVVRTINFTGVGLDAITNFEYNSIGELKSFTDAESMKSEYTYDVAGRKTSFKHPDKGLTTYNYDKANNLIKAQTANLVAPNQFITYEYVFNRLWKINYPDVETNKKNIANTIYTYGGAGSSNQTGRLTKQEDATGRQEFLYDKMGNIISISRSISKPSSTESNFVTTFTYDSWQRLQSMKYPDTEILTYSYDYGGNVNRITGSKTGEITRVYVDRVDYDLYEQRSYIKYGNNTEMLYDYSASLRRLTNLQVNKLGSSSVNFISNAYQYDKVGNITRLNNTAQPNTRLVGPFDHNYSYDMLNRLAAADGRFNGNSSIAPADYKSRYVLNQVKYSPTGMISIKEQEHYKQNPEVKQIQNSYKNSYEYIPGTHQVNRIVDLSNTNQTETFTYDKNGNVLTRLKGAVRATVYWDEENRMRVVTPNGTIMYHYIYDASGERVLKAQSNFGAVYVNGTPSGTSLVMSNYTVYPNGYMVVSPNGTYTNHYYMGSQRIASLTNGAIYKSETKSPDMSELKEKQTADLLYFANKLGYKTVEFEKADADSQEDFTEGDDPKAPTVISVFFYHPDHIGTSTLITDASGNPYQFFLNLPFGETMAEQFVNTSYTLPYKFNGKELDKETGLYYYGARYYDPRISLWMSVDPLLEKYSYISPYAYCLNNPIKLIDPDGRGPVDPWWKIIMDYFGFTSQSNEPEERAIFASRQHALVQISNDLQSKKQKIQNTADWVPFIGGILHLSDGAINNKTQEAGLGFGMILLDVIGGKLINKGANALVGSGKNLLEQIVTKVRYIAGDHLNNLDVTGAVRDIFGDPIIINGKTYNHLKEVDEALQGLGNQIDNLTNAINKGKFTGDVLKQAKNLRGQIQKEKDRIQDILIKAKNAANE